MNLTDISSKIPEIEALKTVQQNPLYHGEGDVYKHTELVLKELEKYVANDSLSDKQKKLLFYAAAFHDIGKLITTRIEDGKIKSPRHALKGAAMTRINLWKNFYNEMDFSERLAICSLVQYHGFPINYIEKYNSIKYLIKVSLKVDISLLSILARADVKGRICNDKDKLLKAIDYFDELSDEYNCWKSSYQFNSDYNRFIYFKKHAYAPDISLYDDTQFEVIMLSGLPAVGKDYWIKNNSDLPVVSLDAIRKEYNISPAANQGKVIQVARERAREFLRKKQSFIWNATNISQRVRSQLISIFTQYQARVRIVYIETNYQELIKRNSKRERPVPDYVIDDLIWILEIPDLTEAHSVDYIIND